MKLNFHLVLGFTINEFNSLTEEETSKRTVFLPVAVSALGELHFLGIVKITFMRT